MLLTTPHDRVEREGAESSMPYMADRTTSAEAAARGARLTIDLAALRSNYLTIAERVQPARTAAVIKADAYGLGADRVAPVLARAGCADFFVAHLSEAVSLKPHVPPDAAIYVLNGLQPGAEALCATLGATPVLNSLTQARLWVNAASQLGRPLPAALQVDSGMSRLGLTPEEVGIVAADPSVFAQAPLKLLMSHLACGDEPARPSNQQQLARFKALAARLPPAPLSLSNSGGAFIDPEFYLDLVRPGVSLYGVSPHLRRIEAISPVVALEARVIQVRTIPPGQGVGYGLSFVSDAVARIATIAIGYADGWPRRLGNCGFAYHGGVRLPIAGRLSMDSLTLDTSALPDGALGLGDYVELIGPHQSLKDVAAQAETIPYEILTSLGDRYHRVYRQA